MHTHTDQQEDFEISFITLLLGAPFIEHRVCNISVFTVFLRAPFIEHRVCNMYVFAVFVRSLALLDTTSAGVFWKFDKLTYEVSHVGFSSRIMLFLFVLC